jgi:actin-like ATPase involved in cell morphogenesis
MNTAHPNYGLNYRLMRAALTMRDFTVSELRSLTRAGENTVYSFLSDLEGDGVGYLRSAPLPSEGRGRPRKKYSLTEAGIDHLMRRSSEMATRFDEEESAERQMPVEVVAEAQSQPGKTHVIGGFPRPFTQFEGTAGEAQLLAAMAQAAFYGKMHEGLPITDRNTSMVVDIGGGTTDIAILSPAGMVYSRMRIAGKQMDEAVVAYIRQRHNLLIGERTAEQIKTTLGSADSLDEPISMEVKGRNLIDGMPQTITIADSEIREALSESIATILQAIREALGHTSLGVLVRGIVLTGEGRLIKNLDSRIRRETGLPVLIVESAMQKLLGDSSNALSDFELMRKFMPASRAIVNDDF